MSPSSWLDLPEAKGGLLVVVLLAIVSAIVWLLERWLDVRDNRRALRRRQIARHAPDTNRPVVRASQAVLPAAPEKAESHTKRTTSQLAGQEVVTASIGLALKVPPSKRNREG